MKDLRGKEQALDQSIQPAPQISLQGKTYLLTPTVQHKQIQP